MVPCFILCNTVRYYLEHKIIFTKLNVSRTWAFIMETLIWKTMLNAEGEG